MGDELAEIYHASINSRQRLSLGAASLGWGLLGASHVAERSMIEAIRRQPQAPGAPLVIGAWVVAVFSHNEHRAQQFAQLNQIAHPCINLDDLLGRREIQCVYVSSHPRHHVPLTMAALAAGKHVLCETPLALTVADARRLQQAAEDRGLVLGVNHAWRGHPILREMHKAIASGMIGDILGGRISNATLLQTQFHTWRLQANGGGVVFDRTIHSLDLIRYLLGDEIAQVSAISAQQILGELPVDGAEPLVEEDVLTVVRTARRNVNLQLHDSFVIPHNQTSVEIYGSSGALIARGCLAPQETGDLLLVRNQQITPIPVAAVDPYWTSIYAFHAAVRATHPSQASSLPDREPLATAEDGIQSVMAALAVRQSIARRMAIRPTYLA